MTTTTDLDRATRLRMYRTMVECRFFEVRAQELFFEGLVRGTTHLGVGQEAVAAGVAAAMREDDYTFCTYRGHNHTLARGVPMAPIFAELFGRGTGLLGGKGGSMHLTSVEHGAMGSYAIVGAHLPIALGAAWSAQYRKSGQIAACFFGDGTTNIGAFHEALNMAAVWKAPVVFVCENNQYMEYTPIGDVTAVEHPAADRASAYGLESIIVDGNDVEAVHEVARAAIDRARAGDGPSLIEALTYRHGGHSRADPGKYRPDDEVAAWKARDPIPAYRRGPRGERRGGRRARRHRRRDARRGRRRRGHRARRPRAVPGRPRDPGLDRRRLVVAELTYRAAFAAAIAQEMDRDPSVVLIGEDVGAAGGVFKLTEGLFGRFGRERVRDTPISEQAIVGAAMGAAMTGLRPIAELMFSDFFAVTWDMVANQIAKTRYMTDGQVSLPLVLRTANGAGLRFGAQHSQSVENWAMAIPGLKVVAPSTPADVDGPDGRRRSATPTRSSSASTRRCFATKGEVPDGEHVDTLGTAEVVRGGKDATIVALAAMVPKAVEAADQLAAEHGLDVEVIDLRSLVPLDTATILASVEKTSRLFTVEENPRLCGWGAEIASIVADEGFYSLDAPIVRITTPHIPLPSAAALEDLALPSVERIVDDRQAPAGRCRVRQRPAMAEPTVAILGTGRMGSAMAERLASRA